MQHRNWIRFSKKEIQVFTLRKRQFHVKIKYDTRDTSFCSTRNNMEVLQEHLDHSWKD